MTLRSLTLVALAMIFLFSCDPAGSPAAAVQPTRADSLLRLKSKFKFDNLREFAVKTSELEYFDWVDSSTFRTLFREEDRQYDPNGSRIDYYYSWQDRDSSFIEFTIMSFDESNYCTILRYYVFDRSGKFISKVDLAADCGDGGWWFEQKGRQVDKTHFTTVSVEAESDVETAEKVEGDTTRHAIQLLPTGLFSQQQVSKKHFVQQTRNTPADSSANATSTDSAIYEP